MFLSIAFYFVHRKIARVPKWKINYCYANAPPNYFYFVFDKRNETMF